jgi:hypothetical protein
MKYDPTLESRPYAPIVLPEIPRREIVIPMPGHWLDEIYRLGIDPGCAVARFVCKMFSYGIPCPVSVREDFRRNWHEIACRKIPTGGYWERMPVPIRADVWQCLEQAAELVGRPVHEVFLKVLDRQLQVRAQHLRENAAAADKEVRLAVSAAALEALEAAGVPVESAVLVFAPRDEEDCQRWKENWGRPSTRDVWSSRKALKWMQAAPHLKAANVKVPAPRWQFIEQAAAAVGITPEEWCLSAIGYRAALEMRRALR